VPLEMNAASSGAQGTERPTTTYAR